MKMPGYRNTDKRRYDTRNQRSIVHHSHTDDLHCKKCCRHRSSKQCRKSGTHTTHNDRVLVSFVKPYKPSDQITNTAADLKGSSLSSGRTAKQMRNDSRHIDQWSKFRCDLLSGSDRRQNQIGPLVLLFHPVAVQKCNHHATDGQKI